MQLKTNMRRQLEHGTKIRSGIAAIALMAVWALGCKPNQTAQEAPEPITNVVGEDSSEIKPVDGPSASALIDRVHEVYQSANSYQDKAVLYLSYRLHGEFMQEPKPWSVTWDSQRRMSADIFNSRIRANGETFTCYVYDLETGNLDNQQLLIPYDQQLPVRQLYRDSIARHFVGGYSELPLDETDVVSLPKLIPPQLSLLTQRIKNPWLDNPTKLARLADTNVDGIDCFVVRSLALGMTSDIWIEKTTHKLIQMSLPLKLLAGEVVTSPEVTDVVLLAKFHEAQFDQVSDPDVFAVKLRSQSTPVRKFVALPESFPSELIGEVAPEFQVLLPNGKAKTRVYFDGKVTAFLWLAGRSSFESIDALQEIANRFDPAKFHLAAIYADSELKQPGSESVQPSDELAGHLRDKSLNFYYDRRLEASSTLKVSTIPSIFVMDEDSRIQFSRSLADKGWRNDLEAVLKRVARGDDVASEMKLEYQRFLDSYHQQLATVSAVDIASLLQPKAADLTQDTSANRVGRAQLRPVKLWQNRQFKRPGNIVALSRRGDGVESGEAYVAFDGWQTVVTLDRQGQTIARHNLGLAEGKAASVVRVGSLGDEAIYAIFSVRGSQVHLFDSSWKPLRVYTSNQNSGNQGSVLVLDCQLTDLNGDGDSELVVATEKGIHLVDPETLETQTLNELTCDSVSQFDGDLVVASNKKVGRLKIGLSNVDETELDFKRVVALDGGQLCGIGVSRTGNWTSVGFSGDLSRNWALAIGPQFFENEIQPVAATKTENGRIVWAIADNEDVIHLVSGNGRWLGDFQSESRLTGLTLANYNGKPLLLVVNEEGIECWDLNVGQSPMIPASAIQK